MQFQVPQFIETEDKIFGPLTIKQFLYITVATVLVLLLYVVLVPWLWIVVGMLIETITLSLVLIKINGRPMTVLATSAFFYVWSPRVYEYHSSLEISVAPPAPVKPATPEVGKMRVATGLRSLMDKLTTTKQAIPNRESPLPEVLKASSREAIKEKYELIRKITGDEEVARRIDYR